MSDHVVTGRAVHSPAPALSAEQTRLRQAAQQLEGVFVEQLFKAMRATVPSDGTMNGGAGEEMFSGLLDEHLAAQTPDQWQRGLGEALYRQLCDAVPENAAAGSEAAITHPVNTQPAASGGRGER